MRRAKPYARVEEPFSCVDNLPKFAAEADKSSSAGSAKTSYRNGSGRKSARAHGAGARSQSGSENRRGHLFALTGTIGAHRWPATASSTERRASEAPAVRPVLRVKRSADRAAAQQARRHAENVQVAERSTVQPGDSVRGSAGRLLRPHPFTCTEIADIDRPHRGSVQLIPDYAQANAEHMREQEVRNRPLPNFLQATQRTVTADMRAVLVDWLVDVAEEYKLVTETLYLSVAYVDRFLSLRCIDPPQLQLLGVAAMCIASKLEEIFPPPVERYSDITDRGFSPQAIVDAESEILRTLDFQLAVPTAKVFLQRFLRAAQVATVVEYRYLEHLSRYVLELSLLDPALLSYRTSTVAASALFLSRLLLAKAHASAGESRPHVIWTRTMEHYTFHQAGELRACVRQLHAVLLTVSSAATRTTAVRTKYRSPRRMSVADMYFVPAFPDDVFERYHSLPVPAEMLQHVPR